MSAPAINQPEDEIHAGLPSFVWKIFTVTAILAMLSLGIYAFGAIYGERMAKVGHSTNTEPLEIIIANDAYSIPANMIRHDNQRVGGVTRRLDTFVHWPTQSGYTSELSAQFSNSDPDQIELVFLTFAERNSLLDMSERFIPVYQSAIEPEKIKRMSNGLFIAPLSPEYGYINERLVYSRPDASGEPPFVARCQTVVGGGERLLLPCEMDIFIGESTEAKIRFSLDQLQRWEAFSQELDVLTKSLLVSDQ